MTDEYKCCIIKRLYFFKAMFMLILLLNKTNLIYSMRIILILLSLTTLAITTTFSQQTKTYTRSIFGNLTEKHQAWEIGLSNGLIFYTGDVHSGTIAFKEMHPCFGAYSLYHFTDNISIKPQLYYGQFSGSDFNYASHINRNFIFKTHIFEPSVEVIWEPWGHIKYNVAQETNRRGRISPYFHLGFGGLFINPKVDYYEEGNKNLLTQIAYDKAHTKKQYPIIPFGIGWRFDVSPQWTLGGDASWRMPFSDYLDGISRAANPEKQDWYSVATLSLGYRFKYKRDKDNDGVPDDTDECPELPGFTTAKGCPDRDNDGVLDKNDVCPDDKGPVELRGCPDQDADGIADYEDHCPYNSGLQKMQGCPDRDKDGVVDYKDLCPDLVGTILARGCPDQDGDGVMDKQDKCPLEKGTIQSEGCPVKDWDNDGTPDYADACPEKPGDKKNNGCPLSSTVQEEKVIQQYTLQDPKNIAQTANDSTKIAIIQQQYHIETKKLLMVAEAKIGFLDNTTKLKDVSYPALNSIVEMLSKDAVAKVEIQVFNVDSKDKTLNKKLSEARGRTIYYFLIKNGIAAERIRYKGFGDEDFDTKINQEEHANKKSIVTFMLF
jgi:OmpA-OmpF porin, OOP family